MEIWYKKKKGCKILYKNKAINNDTKIVEKQTSKAEKENKQILFLKKKNSNMYVNEYIDRQ